LEVNVHQGNFKILRLLPQVLIIFLVVKWIPPTRSKTAKIGQKNKKNLGFKRFLRRKRCMMKGKTKLLVTQI
jgi:hypothetical protein